MDWLWQAEGRTDNDHREGVAVIISKSKANTVLQWKPVNERLLYVRMNSKYVKLSVVVGYAQIDNAEEEDKNAFYDAIQSVLEDIPQHDVLMLLSDFNAKIGCDNKDRERTMGRHEVGVITDNGERLVNFCQQKGPCGRTQNQIDHIINGRWRHSLQDVCVMRHADIGSDHSLLVAKVTLKLRKSKTGDIKNQRYDVVNCRRTPVTVEEEKLKRWKQHFESILNHTDPPTLADIPEAEEDLDINLGNITVTEVNEAIHKLKNGKASGDDGVCPEMLKAADTVTPQLLCQILQKIWESEEAPSDWKTGTIVKLPKKGDLGNLDGILRQEQAGFRKGKSCIDHIFVPRQILEQSHEWNGSLYLVFVNFEKAFDSLHRDSLWKILRHYGIPQKLVKVIRSLYENFECRVIHNNQLTEPFKVETGVKQGCILSPLRFSMAIDWIMRRTTEGRRQGKQWTLTSLLDDLDYADDIGLLASRNQDIQQKTQQLKNTRLGDPITINGQPLQDVDEFIYLGSKVTTDGDCAREINTRISKANQAFVMLKPIRRTTSLSMHTKLCIFKSNVLSVLYGSECWKTTATIERKLEVFQNKCLCRIMKIFWQNMITSMTLRERAGANSIAETIALRRWRWLGHVCRMPLESLPRVALRWTLQGKRNRGRPKET
ncbi:uncharacterized protein LOC127865671 [Dreissena polymorpha]|uniref:uncharacterized protein LOC127865671 n=1 Tax=Dreissena polymorpha TaxID=45954 RepID=UPI002264A209|nr:uncharacterized protein LOC127865671 [Dreissena polymorpha]